MNSSTFELASQLDLVQTYLTRYFMMPVYLLGNLSNILNIILFSQRDFRANNICAWYFISLSLANLLIIDVGGITRSLSWLNGFNVETSSLIICKCRQYFVQFSLLLGRYFICLIAIDRWMITSPNELIRQMSSLRNGRYLIIIGTCICAIFSIHALIGFLIKFNRCFAYLSTSYSVFFSIYNVLSTAIPITITTVVSMLIIVNIRRSRHRIRPAREILPSSNQTSMRSTGQNDMKFIQLALIQSLVFGLLNIPFVIYVIYDFGTSQQIKSSDRQAIDAFLFAISIHPIYIFSSITFITYTLASSTFRKRCISTIHHVRMNVLRWFGQ